MSGCYSSWEVRDHQCDPVGCCQRLWGVVSGTTVGFWYVPDVDVGVGGAGWVSE